MNSYYAERRKNRTLLFWVMILCLCGSGPAFANDALMQKNPKLVIWGSNEGIARIERSSSKVDFFRLANFFESQSNKIYCGVASSAIVLNALRIRRSDQTNGASASNASRVPKAVTLVETDKVHLPSKFDPFFERYTQENIFSSLAKSKQQILGLPILIDNKETKDFGLQLNQLAQFLSSHRLDITARVVDGALSEKQIRAELIANMNTVDDYVLVNYKRSALGQKGGGHISPLGAYDVQSDSFLILDVNSNKADWVWVETKDLVAAMKTFDTIENRGYLLVSNAAI